jgi:hypothetical protein
MRVGLTVFSKLIIRLHREYDLAESFVGFEASMSILSNSNSFHTYVQFE